MTYAATLGPNIKAADSNNHKTAWLERRIHGAQLNRNGIGVREQNMHRHESIISPMHVMARSPRTKPRKTPEVVGQCQE